MGTPRTRTYRHFREVEAAYLADHPEEVGPYVTELFEDYAADGDMGALLASLRAVAQAQGVGALAARAGLTRQGLQAALSPRGNPRFATIVALMGALGLRLRPEAGA